MQNDKLRFSSTSHNHRGSRVPSSDTPQQDGTMAAPSGSLLFTSNAAATHDATLSLVVHQACESGDLETVQSIFANRQGQVYDNDAEQTKPYQLLVAALHVSIRHGHLAIVSYLLELDASLVHATHTNYNDKNNDTNAVVAPLLHLACRHCDNKASLQVVEVLLSQGADPTRLDSQGKTALDMILEHDANPPLDVIRCLLAMTEQHRQASRNNSQRRLGQERYSVSVVRQLTRQWNVNATDIDGQTALHHACRSGNVRLAQVLIQLGGNQKQILEMACHWNHVALLQMLMRQGANLNATDMHGHTLLHRLCLHDAPVATIQALVDGRAVNVNSKDDKGRTPLHFACQMGHVEIVQCLLSRKADVNAADDKGRTALHLVCGRNIVSLAQHKETTLDVLLLQHSYTNVNCRDAQGCTALHMACRWGHVSLMKRLLQRADVDVNQQDNDGLTPLHWASLHGKLVALDLLLAHAQIRVDSTTNCLGQTPLHLAAQQGHWPIVTRLLSTTTSSTTKQHSNMQMVRQADANGWTAVMYVCQHDHVAIMEWLVQTFGSHVIYTCATDGLTTPLSLACHHEHLNLIYYLVRQHQLYGVTRR